MLSDRVSLGKVVGLVGEVSEDWVPPFDVQALQGDGLSVIAVVDDLNGGGAVGVCEGGDVEGGGRVVGDGGRDAVCTLLNEARAKVGMGPQTLGYADFGRVVDEEKGLVVLGGARVSMHSIGSGTSEG